MAENPSSDDLIRQAKDSFAARKMPGEHPVEDGDPVAEHQTVADRMYEKLEGDRDEDVERTASHHTVTDRMYDKPESDRVEKTPSEPTPFKTYPPKQRGTEAPESSSGGGRAWRILGIAILLPIAALWALLLIGIALDPEDAGEVLSGAVILTGIPFGIAVFALKRAARS